MIRSSSKGTSGFRRTAVVGSRSRIALKINAEVSPRNGSVPVHISYSTAPKEKRSVRASSSFPLTCSGDIYATVNDSDHADLQLSLRAWKSRQQRGIPTFPQPRLRLVN